MRRGKPTNHKLYGENVAILAGDALLCSAFHYIAQETKNVSSDRIVELIKRLGTAVGAYGITGGQVMDLESENDDDITIDDLKWIHLHKTGALLRISVAAGGILGGATNEEITNLEKYGEKIGLAFQSKFIETFIDSIC